MCNIWKYPTDIEQEIKPEIAALMPGGLRRINLTGGEPMLRDDIEELMGILYKKCHVVEISTNGFYTEKLVSIAEKFPRVMIRISLEGLPVLNDKLRGTRDGFDHALRSILELKKTKAKNIGFSVVICDRNVKDLVNLYDLAVGLNVEFAQSTMHNSWYFHKSDNAVNDKQIVLDELERFIGSLLSSKRRSMKLRVKDWLRAFFNLRLYNYIKTGVSQQGVCTAGSDLFFVDPFGNVTPCNGSDEEWIMGNLKYNTFEQIWNSPRAEEIRKKSLRMQKWLFLAIREDAKSYEAVLKAFRLPKNTEKERSYRSKMIQRAYQGATVIPQGVCELSIQLLKNSEILILKGNPNAISDVGVAAFLANAAFDGGFLNININLDSIRDKMFLRKMDTLKKRYVKEKNRLVKRIGKALNKHHLIS